MISHRNLCILLLALTPIFASCGATARYIPYATEDFGLNDELPPHPDCMPGTVDLKVDGDFVDDEFVQNLVAAMSKNIKDFTGSSQKARAAGKQPQYKIRVIQITKENEAEFSKPGALFGAAAGGTAGYFLGGTQNKWVGAGVGAAVGSIGGAIMGGEKKNAFTFAVYIQQMTSEEGKLVINQTQQSRSLKATQAMDSDASTGIRHTSEQADERFRSFDKTTNYSKVVGGFTIVVEGTPLLTADSSMLDTMKDKLIEMLPNALQGGRRIDWDA